MNQLKKHILFFDFLENYYVSKDEVSKHHLNVIKKSNFVKEDKTIVRSTHPPLETVLLNCKGTEVKASPFKIADDQTPIYSIIKQSNIYIYIEQSNIYIYIYIYKYICEQINLLQNHASKNFKYMQESTTMGSVLLLINCLVS